jgi:hypothetical protein
MKRLEDIERMSPEELDRIAGASGAEIPADLGERLGNAVLAAAAAEDGRSARRSTRFGYAAGAVTAVALASLAIVLSLPHAPKDTFDDPLLAYAELEKTFSYISSKVDRGLDIAAVAEPAIEKTTGAINNTINKKSK